MTSTREILKNSLNLTKKTALKKPKVRLLKRRPALPADNPVPALRDWIKASTIEDLDMLAELAQTSRSVIYQLQYAKTKGGRSASSELAARLEEGSEQVALVSSSELPELDRGMLNVTCAECKFYLKCKTK